MSEGSNDSKEQLPVDDKNDQEMVAASQAIISNQLAKKIWSVTSSDVALGLREFPGEKLPYTPTDFEFGLGTPSRLGSVLGSLGRPGSKQPPNGNATAHILEVGRALFGETYGFPETGSSNYYKAAENYSLFGKYFHDFPKDTATCFADLEQGLHGDSNPPPGFERPPPRSYELFEQNPVPTNVGTPTTAPGSNFIGPSCSTPLPQQQQRQPPRVQPAMQHCQPGTDPKNEIPLPQLYHQQAPNPSHHQLNPHAHAAHVHRQPPVGTPLQPPMTAAQQQQQQQHHQQQQLRAAGALGGGGEIGGGLCGHSHAHHHGHSHANANEFNLSQLYQQLMARNMRHNPLHHQQQHMVHTPQPHHQHTPSSAAAAAAMLYANFEQQIRQLHLQQQLQQQQQQQQQQLRQARMPRAIYGGNGAQGGPGAVGSGAPPAPPQSAKEPPTTGHK